MRKLILTLIVGILMSTVSYAANCKVCGEKKNDACKTTVSCKDKGGDTCKPAKKKTEKNFFDEMRISLMKFE